MADADSCVTTHMAASRDGFIARKDGSVDWLETSDDYEDGRMFDPDIDVIAARIKEAGWVLDAEPSDTPRGARILGLRDPDGYRFPISSGIA